MRPGAWRSRLTAVARHSVFPIRYSRGDAGAPSPETHGAQRRFCSGSMPQRIPFPGSPNRMDYSYDTKRGDEGRSFLRHVLRTRNSA